MDNKWRESFLNKVRDIHGDKYTLLGEYKGTKTKTLFRHEVCGYEWETAPANIY